MDELEKMLWERISKNGFASLWMALGMWCNFRYSDYNEDLGMMKRLVFCLEVGSLSFILDGWLKLSRFQGMVIWYLGYFVCLAFEVNIAVFLRQQCAVLPWQCLPIYVSTLMVYVFVATHGPWSLVLFPMRLIYNFLAEREEDARSVAMKLCILISIELLLYVYCQDYDMRNGGKVHAHHVSLCRDAGHQNSPFCGHAVLPCHLWFCDSCRFCRKGPSLCTATSCLVSRPHAFELDRRSKWITAIRYQLLRKRVCQFECLPLATAVQCEQSFDHLLETAF
jgi:hypothetical protein